MSSDDRIEEAAIPADAFIEAIFEPPTGEIRDIVIHNSAETGIRTRSRSTRSTSSPDDNNLAISSEIALKSLELTFLQKVVVGSGHVLNDLCASLWFSYLLLYFENVVGLTSDYAAYLMLLGQIVDAVSTPLIGYEADNSNHCVFCRRGYGRCKSWHLFGVILVTLSFPFVFAPCISCDGATGWAKLIYYAPFIAIFQIGWASTQISHLALVPKMHPNELVRTELLAIRYGFTVASNITVFILAWQTFGFSKEDVINGDDESKFQRVAMMAVGIGLIFSIIFHVFVREKPDDFIKKCVALLNNDPTRPRALNNRRDGLGLSAEHDEDEASLLVHDEANRPESPELYVTLEESPLSTKWLSLGKPRVTIKEWLRLPQLYVVALVYMATRLSVNVTQVYIPLYLQKSLRLPSGSVATIPLTMYTFGLIITLFIKLINKYLGRQVSYVFGATLTVAGAVCVLVLDLQSQIGIAQYRIYGVAALMGAGSSAILITSLSITADLIGNNVESGAFVYGVMSFTDKLSCGLAVMLINSLVPCQKDDSSIDCNPAEEHQLGRYYTHVLAYASGGCALVGVIGVGLLTLLLALRRRRRARRPPPPASPPPPRRDEANPNC